MGEMDVIEKIERIDGDPSAPAAFVARDFSDVAELAVVRRTLARLESRDAIKRLLPGVYCRPRTVKPILTSAAFERKPDMEAVANAYARRKRWRTAPGRAKAANALGLSTQVPVVPVIAIDAPTEGTRRYDWDGGGCVFEPGPAWLFEFESVNAATVAQASASFPGKVERQARLVAGSVDLDRAPAFPEELRSDAKRAPDRIRRCMEAIAAELERVIDAAQGNA